MQKTVNLAKLKIIPFKYRISERLWKLYRLKFSFEKERLINSAWCRLYHKDVAEYILLIELGDTIHFIYENNGK